MTGRLRGAYGAGWPHLAGHLAFVAVAAYVVVQLADARGAVTILLWVVGAALIHDLLFVAVYAAADRVLGRAAARSRVPFVNHVRFVVVVSGVLFLAWFPVLLGKSDGTIARNAGLQADGYLGRWLAVTAGLAVVSALAYALRAAHRRRVARIDQLHDPVGAAADEDASRA